MGFVLLGLWLVLEGLNHFVSLRELAVLLPILAMVAGILILVGR